MRKQLTLACLNDSRRVSLTFVTMAVVLMLAPAVVFGQDFNRQALPEFSPILVQAGSQPDPSLVPRLIKELQNPDEAVRLRAAKELGKLGAAARDAVPMLQKLAQDPDEDVREMAASALARINAIAEPGGPRPDLFMLAVGIDRYKPPINSLSGCVNDADGMAKVFQRQAGKIYGRVDVQLLSDANATRAKIDAGLEALRTKGKSGDWYVVILSGHGGPKLNRWGFVTHEGGDVTDAALLDLADELANADKKVLVIIDACFAGQLRYAAHPILNKYTEARKGGIILMISSMPSQTSAALMRYSAFARAVEEGLTGLADYDGDKSVTLKELRRFTYNRVYELCLDKRAWPGLFVGPQDSAIDSSLSMPETISLARAERAPAAEERDGPGSPIPSHLTGLWISGAYRLRLDPNGVFNASIVQANRVVQQGDGTFKATPKNVILRHKQGADRLEIATLNGEEFRFRFQGREIVLRREKSTVTAGSVAGTVWNGSESLAEFGKLTFQFEPGGKAVMIEAQSTVNGNWSQNGNQVTITFQNCVYRGTIQGQTLSGSAQFLTNNQTWTFSVTRGNVAPSPDEQSTSLDALPVLQKMLHDPDENVRRVAAHAIERIKSISSLVQPDGKEPPKSPEVQRLIQQLQDPDEVVRLKAAKELGKLGAAARAAIPALQNALKDSDDDVRIVAARSLKAIQAASGPGEQVQRLIRDLQSADEIVRLKAAKDLGKLGPAASDAVSALQKLLQDPDEDVRRVAANSLRLIQASAGPGEALQKLITQLANADELVRLKAVKDLAKMGSAAKAALPALEKLRQDPDEDIRRVVANAIERIRGEARPDPESIPSLAGTIWEGKETLPGFGQLAFQFDPDGKALMSDAKSKVKGTWKQTGNQVMITFSNCVYEGTIKGQTLSGTARFTEGDAVWTFTVTRAGAGPAPAPKSNGSNGSRSSLWLAPLPGLRLVSS